MPIVIDKKEMWTSVQLGASQTATVLHLSPWESAFDLWALKTGRRAKPEQTAAMKYGLEMEPRTISHYLESNSIDPRSFQQQVAAQHRDLPWLKCVCDLWNPATEELVQVKSPSSPSLMREMAQNDGRPPQHYLVQCLTEMAIFEATSEVFYVVNWTVDPPETADALVTWEDRWDEDMTCREYWDEIAVPCLKAFWQLIVDDRWPEGDYAQPDEKEWLRAIKMRQDGQELIAEGEKLKGMGDQKLKHMLGTAQAASAGGWKAQWSTYKPTYALNIKCENGETLKQIEQAVADLRGFEGVREIKPDIRPEQKRFRVDQLENK